MITHRDQTVYANQRSCMISLMFDEIASWRSYVEGLICSNNPAVLSIWAERVRKAEDRRIELLWRMEAGD